jgi:hypothetical protein
MPELLGGFGWVLVPILAAVVFIFGPWVTYKIIYPKHKKADDGASAQQRTVKRWIPTIALTKRQKKLIVLLMAAAWISIMVLDRWNSRWDPPQFDRLLARSLPAVLFAAIFIWWYPPVPDDIRLHTVMDLVGRLLRLLVS